MTRPTYAYIDALPDPDGDVGATPVSDPVNHPSHYTQHGTAECIDIAETMTFCQGNAFKYIWRAGAKGDRVEDLRKARWYLDREIKRLEGLNDA